MSQLLILTNSVDGTCDSLVHIMKETGQNFFRWNIDLWQSYKICFDTAGFLITDPTGRKINAIDSDVFMLWRKPFVSQMDFNNLGLNSADHEQARSQMRQWLLSLIALMKPQNRIRLIEPYADRRLPKLYQLHVATKFFKVPESHFGLHAMEQINSFNAVTKPLGDLTVGDGDVFYTRRVNIDDLFRPFPWFIQEAIIGGRDVTCAYIDGDSHFYVSDFKRDEASIDWRVEINTGSQSPWVRLEHPDLLAWEEAVHNYMKGLGLHYGRLDFILQDNSLYFLECNTNGQFGWLDEEDSLSLHRKFLAAALNPACTVI